MNKAKLVIVFLPFALSLLPLQAKAESNPLSNLFGSIIVLGNKHNNTASDNQNTADKSQDNSNSPSPNEIMRDLASKYDGIHGAHVPMTYSTECNKYINPGLTEDIKKMEENFKMGHYAYVGGLGFEDANAAAFCAFANRTIATPSDESLVGFYLGWSVLANHKAGMDTPEGIRNAQYALILLKQDAQANKNLISLIENSGVIPDVPVAAENADFKMTAFNAATQYSGNSFAFKRKYTGKTLRISGVVERINGSDKSALIVLAGIHKKNPNDEGWGDVVQCTITEDGALNQAMNISKGQAISVQGIYKPDQYTSGVSLDDCRIAN